jgi:flagellar basal body-associated protein FliL
MSTEWYQGADHSPYVWVAMLTVAVLGVLALMGVFLYMVNKAYDDTGATESSEPSRSDSDDSDDFADAA